MDLTGKTPEEIQELADSQEKLILEYQDTIEGLNGTIEKLNKVIANAKPASQTEIATNKKAEAPVIPAELLEFNGKQYKWTRSGFRLPGDVKKYTAQEASIDLAPGGIVERLLALDGQEVLIEQA